MAGDVSKSVNVAINVINGVSKQVGSIVSSFGKITEGATKATKATDGLNKSMGRIKAPVGIKNLAKDLGSLGKVDSSGVTKLADGIKKLNGAKFPTFTKINSELATHAQRVNDLVKAYGDLQKASSKVNLKSFTQNAATANKQVKNLGTSSQKTGASFSQWGYALGSASTGLSKFGTQIYGVTRGFSAVSKEMGLAMAAFTTSFATLFALKGVVSDIAEFDDAIRSAGAVAQASSVQLTQLSDAARAMGESTRYTAKDAAEALKALAMTGLDVNESIATLPTVLNLAAAANMDLGESADIVTNIMVGYGKTIGDLPKIADLMTAAFTNSNTSLQELGVAMKYVGPVANAAGQSLEETTGILASLANAGYRGSKAGTTLRTAFSRLLAPTKKMSDALAHYGITLKDLTEPNGDLKSFSTILDTMSKKSITAGDALTIFGKRAGPGILSLIEQGTPAIEAMNQKIAESEGTALKAAYEMESGLGGALRRLRSMWEEVSIAIGKTIETDVQGFLEALTEALKENKDQIVSVVSALFQFVGVIAKVVGWMAEFVAEHFKMLSAMAAVTAAIKLLTMTSKDFMAIGIIKYFSTLFTSIKWSGISTGITGVATALNNYTKAAKTATGVQAAQSITTLSTTPWAGIATGLKNIASALLSTAVAAGKAAVAFAIANPAIAAAAAAATIAYGAIKFLDENLEGAAESALKASNATKELNRDLEYQLAELGLINKELERGNVKDFADAEERLRDIINQANVPLEKRIEYLKRSRDGADEAKDVLEELTDVIKKEKDANDSKQIVNATKARDLQAKAIEAQAKKLEYYYGIQVDGQTRLNTLEKAASFTNTIGFIKWIKKKSGAIEENVDKYEDLISKQKVMEGNYQSMIAEMITAGKTTEEFNKALDKIGDSSVDIEEVKKAFSDLKKEAEDNKEVMNDLKKLSAASLKALEEEGKRKLKNFKAESEERQAIEKQTLYNIAAMEAQGTIDHETAEMAKLQASLDSAQERVSLAKETYAEIDELAVGSREDAMGEIVAAEEAAAQTRLKILEKIAAAEKTANDKIEKYTQDRIDEEKRHETKLDELRDKNSDSHKDAEVAKTKRIKEINQSLHDKLRSLDDSLYEKRRDLAKKRVEIIKNSVQSIKDIESAGEDKLRSIRQRGMTDVQVDADNRKVAQEKLKEGEALVAEARRTGDEAALERGTKLISQSSDIASGLSSEKDATNGVEDAIDALKDADKVRTKLELANIAKKLKEEKAAVALKKKYARESAEQDTTSTEDLYDQKLAKADKFYLEEKKKEDSAHDDKVKHVEKELAKYNEKLDLIVREKELMVDLMTQYDAASKSEAGSEVWTKANAATEEAIGKVKEYGETVSSMNDKEVNITFKGTASPTTGLTETLENIKAKFAEISSEMEVNVIFKIDGKGLSEGLPSVQKEIESLIINIPATVDMKELEEATKLIDKYRKKNIKVTVDVENRDLNKTDNVLSGMKNKTVTLTTKVIGYDKLVKAKNMIDSIKSKTVTVTTRHKSVQEKEAGGYIEPEHYATGGDVFRRLSSRFISSGGGKKDDVPAMLMKGEFVQKVSAVKKYGKDFMARLNAGLIPQSVARMYNTGGFVEPEHYATGGHVGYGSSMRKARKKYEEELLGKRSQLSGSMDLNVNNKISGFDILSSGGIDAISSLKNVIGESISAFAFGGTTFGSNNVREVSSNLNREYTNKIAAARRSGDSALAEILRQEQKDLADLSAELVIDLKNLEEEYKEFKEEATEDHNERIEDLTSAYNESSSDLDSEHSDSLTSLKEEFLENVASIDDSQEDSDDQYNDALDEYKQQKEDLEQEKRDTELDNALAHRESISSGHALGKQISGILGSKEAREWRDARGGALTLDQITGRYQDIKEGPYNASGNPDFGFMREMLGKAFPELKSLLSGNYEDFLSDASTTSKIAVGSSIVEASEGKGGISVSYADTNYGIGLAKQINEIEKAFNDSDLTSFGEDFEERLKEITDAESETKSDYKETTSENEADKAELRSVYDSDVSEENNTYSDQKNEYDTDYKDSIKDENDSYLENMSDREKEYSSNVSDIRESFNNSSQAIKETAKEDVDSQKKIISNDVDALKSVLDEELKKLGSKSSSSSASSFLQLLNIPKFNDGGFINNTATSVKGKDSILAAVAPEEYVIKASAVRKFGRGFFDSLNNFRIPQFNTGGLVGEGSSMISGAASETVKHALELTINGSQKGELTGSGPTISDILNDLALAKLRA